MGEIKMKVNFKMEIEIEMEMEMKCTEKEEKCNKYGLINGIKIGEKQI